MLFINPIQYILQFEYTRYILAAIGFYGVMCCLKLLIMRKGL